MLYFSSKNPIITAFGIVPIGVVIPPIEEEYAIHSIKIFEKKLFSFCLKLVSTINLTIGNISKHVAVFDNHMLMNAVIKIKQRSSDVFVFPKKIMVFIATL
tara:strand:+ start:499 stop:801 length:303 start_codon:yes stop_codon:yes gene_type:complete